MSNSTDGARPVVIDRHGPGVLAETKAVVCPRCKGFLGESPESYSCDACGERYPVVRGIPCFSMADEWHGEFTRDEMNELNSIAEASGWRHALEHFIKPRKPGLYDLLTDERRIRWTELIRLEGNESVLDLGCGLGPVSMRLAGRVRSVVSLDSCLERVEFLKIAKEKEGWSNIQPVCNSNILQLPFADGHFDVVTLIGVFEYLPVTLPDLRIEAAQLEALREIRRVLKRGGVLYIATKNRFGWQYLAGAKDHNGLRFGPALPRFLADGLTRLFHGRRYRIILDGYSAYKKLLSSAGFHEARFYWPVPSYQFTDRLYPIAGSLGSRMPFENEPHYSAFKRTGIRLLASLGLLKHLIPLYSIVARKDA